jgi:hypothetical protein
MREYDDPSGLLEVDTTDANEVSFGMADRLGDQAGMRLGRDVVAALHAQLGEWLRVDPPIGNVPCPTCGEYDPYDCTCPDRQRSAGRHDHRAQEGGE